MKTLTSLLWFSLVVLAVACREKPATLFELMDDTGIQFTNVVVDGKVENGFTFRNFYNGGGTAIGDINNDGLADVFLTGNMSENELYLNLGNFKFRKITKSAGFKQDSMWSTGVVMADVNSDGWLDVFVCNSGHMEDGNRRNKLYINNKDLTFTESAAKYGLDVVAYTTHVSFFDYDLDGDLDCFMINNSPIPINTLGFVNRRDLPENQWNVADFLKGGGDHLFRNDNGRFTHVNKETGIHGSLISFGLGVSVGDVNNDQYPDIYVANDSYERDYLYINQKNGTFRDEYEECIEHTSLSSMGADIADINNDGHPEIFTTDMLPLDDYRLKTLGAFDNIDYYRGKEKMGFHRQFMKNCLQLNNGNGRFSEIANFSGVSATDWSWGALMFDADNDGYNDIFVCNGVNRDVTDLDFMNFFADDAIKRLVLTGKKDNVYEVLKRIPVNPVANIIFRNNGNLQFTNEGENWGITQKSFSNGAAYGDLDNDGDLDLVVNNENHEAFIYKNNAREQTQNNFIGFQLRGKPGNTYAVGSKIQVFANNQVLTREVVPSRGFQSSVDYKILVGLGTILKIDSVMITWPDRTYSVFHPDSINKVYTHAQNGGSRQPDSVVLTRGAKFFDSIPVTFEQHKEDDYIDFYNERNIPMMLSREGPPAASGDVNGDGRDDVFIGAPTGQAGQLYLQTSDGKFEKHKPEMFAGFADFEDVAALFFDCDRDKDLDLFIGAGGNNVPPNSRQLQHRLYKNDGNGNFTIDVDAFPMNGMNVSVAVHNDFDNDGDEDLFVGCKSVPGEYGLIPISYLYENDGRGRFKDVASSLNAGLSKVGMVSSAAWADMDGDQDKELIVSGLWMAPKIFSIENRKAEEIKTNISNMFGWWQSLTVSDVNSDGRADLVLGNIGENFALKPTSENPIKLWVADVDGNADLDKILSHNVNGIDKPVFSKNEMQEQVPFIKKENLKHTDYAKKSIQDLFKADQLNKGLVQTFNYSSSCIALNNGNGQFTIQKMPARAQLSSVNKSFCLDINSDGKVDIITGSNLSGFPPQFGRLDASEGDIFLNDGKGNFNWMAAKQSGLSLRGEIKSIVELKGKNSSCLLFLRNNDFPLIYKLVSPPGTGAN